MVDSKLRTNKAKIINTPLNMDDVLSLKIGDMVLINGKIVTCRDRLHRFFFNEEPSRKEIPFNLEGAIIYHCGPIIRKTGKGYGLIAGGPTTSMRFETYEHKIISEYGVRGVMGKGGMGIQTLNSFKKYGCVYFHTIGGAAAYLADRVKKVAGVWKLEEFGETEAMWIFNVENFPAMVTMDAHGKSLHEEIEKKSLREFKKLIRRA